MPGGLQALPEVPRGPDLDSMKRFLALENQAARRTHYQGVARIMPGHYAIVTPEGLTETRYWNPDLSPLRLATHDDYVAALADHLENAVAAALRGAENLVGAQLSSGFDSTAVVTTAARQLINNGGKIVAYTAAPREGYGKTLPDRIADESILANATVAMYPNIEHVVLRSDRTPLDNLSRTSSIHGMPVLNICNQTWYDAISDDAAARGITIMLEAANGNATISETGLLALPELVRAGRLLSWSKVAWGLIRTGEARPLKILWKSFNPLLPNNLYRWLMERRFGSAEMSANTTGLKDEHLEAATADAASEYPLPNAQERVLSGGWIRPSNNSQADRVIMLASGDNGASYKGMLAEWKIDCRDPTADRRLVEFSLRVPVEQLIHGGKPRAMLREVLADRAPPEVLDNRMRGYQAADWHEWLNRAREDAAHEVSRIEEFEPSAEILDVERLKELVESWPEQDSSYWTEFDAVLNYRCCLLRSISAASFMRQAAGLD
jgi:asparagine synthase (glutamine-hydrolysing)